ncbi:MAG: hypothetical protein AAFP97_07015 [Pseudomonadota bacterium]
MLFALHHVPKLSYSEALSCLNVARMSQAEFDADQSSMGRLMANHMSDFYGELVKVGAASGAKKSDIFEGGQFKSDVEREEAILTGGIIARSRKCGEMFGAAATSSGFSSAELISEMIEITGTEASPETRLGLIIIGSAASALNQQGDEVVVECASVLRGYHPTFVDLDTQSLTWMIALENAVETELVDETKFEDISSAFVSLQSNPGQNFSDNDAYSQEHQRCRDLADQAIADARDGVN